MEVLGDVAPSLATIIEDTFHTRRTREMQQKIKGHFWDNLHRLIIRFNEQSITEAWSLDMLWKDGIRTQCPI